MLNNRRKWKATKDPLFRGNSSVHVKVPTPDADSSVVRHILYLGGAGRESPYLSMTEDDDIARHFAGKEGKVYSTTVKKIAENKVNHIGRKDILQWLKGKGKGLAKWRNAFEVIQARRYVEENAEHLADFRKLQSCTKVELKKTVGKIYK